MTAYHQIIPEGTMQKNPVLVILNGLAAALSLVLVATNVTGVTHLDTGQTAAVVAAVAAVCNLVALAVGAAVYSPATHAEDVAAALATPAPGQPQTVNVTVAGSVAESDIAEQVRRGLGGMDGR